MTDSPKFVLIGLDGATFDWLTPLTETGKLPYLKTLLDESGWGRLQSTVPPFTATAWSSFMTGLNPGQHGILSFEMRDRFNYDRLDEGFVNSDRLQLTLWEILNVAGKTTGVVNVPLTYPARPVDGYMITGMMSPKQGERITYPPELAQELDNYQIDVEFIRDGDDFDRYVSLDKKKMLTEIRDVMRGRIRQCQQLLTQQPTDFFMVVFTCTDRLSHFFWDELCEVAAGKLSTPLHHDILALLIELDQGLQTLVECAGADSSVMLMSDHGFGPSPEKRAHLNVWLQQQGWLTKRGRESLADLEYWRVWLGQRTLLKKMLRALIPQKSQDNLTKSSMQNSRDIVDWSKTKAFFVPIYFQVCGISINQIDERREGIVASGAGYDALRTDIMNALKALKDPETNRPIVERVRLREELFKGDYLEGFPDIIVELDPAYVGAQSLAGSRVVEPHQPFRSGEHREDGIFSLKTPHTKAAPNIAGLKLEDVAATVCYVMNVPLPHAFDAQVQKNLFKDGHLEEQSIQYADIKASYRPDEYHTLSADEELVEQRLRGLGYLE